MSQITLYQKPRREDWEQNQAIIATYVKGFIKQYKRMPGQQEIATGTGINVRTVRRHLKLINKRRSTQTAKIFAPDVIMAVAIKAISGDHKHAKLFLQYVMDWNPRFEMDTGSAKQFAQQLRDSMQGMEDATMNFNGAIDADFEVTGDAPKTVDPDT